MIDLISRKLATQASTNAAAALLAITSKAPSLAQLGAVGDGNHPTDDQTAFQSAITAIMNSLSTAPTGVDDIATFQSGVMLEPGIYDAGGLTQAGGAVRIVARVPGTVVIRIPANQYFMTVSGSVQAIQVEGITFVGGKGAFQFTNTGGNVRLLHSFSRCCFYNYTECAISNSAGDHPYLRVRDCMFFGANGASTIGVAWGGYLDQGLIQDCAFLQNAYHIKMGPGLSSTFTIRHNDFISWGSITTLADIWVVPNSSDSFGVNSGFGSLITENKFGNENQNTSSPRILIAAESTTLGTSRANRPPATTDSGYLSQLIITNNVISGVAGITAPVIESRITEVRNLEWRGNKFNGGAYGSIINWTNRTTGYNPTTNSVFEFTAADVGSSGLAAQRFSNISFGQLFDYAGLFPGDPNNVLVWPVSDNPAMTLLGSGIAPSARGTFGGASKARAADPSGGMDYDLVTCAQAGSGNGLAMGLGTGAPAAGGPIFVEMALQQAPARSVAQVTVEVFNYATSTLAMQRIVSLPATTGYLRLPVVLPAHATPSAWQLRIYPSGTVTTGTADSFITGDWIVNTGDGRIGRAKALAAFPVLPRNQAMVATAAATLPLGWSINNPVAGLTYSVARVGTDAYGSFFDLTLSGSTTGNGNFLIFPDSTHVIEAAAGQCWQFYAPVRLMAGSVGNFSSLASPDGVSGQMSLSISLYSAAGAYISQYDSGFTPGAGFARYGRADWGSSTLPFNGSTGEIKPYLRISLASGVTVNATLRIYTPTIRRLI